jgi:hypothetical protein
MITPKGHDPCLANLPGVVNACCGHGVCFPYATLKNGFCLTGRLLAFYLAKVGKLGQFEACMDLLMARTELSEAKNRVKEARAKLKEARNIVKCAFK